MSGTIGWIQLWWLFVVWRDYCRASLWRSNRSQELGRDQYGSVTGLSTDCGRDHARFLNPFRLGLSLNISQKFFSLKNFKHRKCWKHNLMNTWKPEVTTINISATFTSFFSEQFENDTPRFLSIHLLNTISFFLHNYTIKNWNIHIKSSIRMFKMN